MAKKTTALSITETSARLASHPAYFESIIHSSSDAIIGKTLDGIIVSWNKAAEKLYGYTEEEIIGKPIYTIAPPDRHEEIKGILKKISKGQQVALHETIRMAKDGRHLFISVTVSPILDTDGTVIGASAIARDITEQRMITRHLEFMNHASTVLGSSLNYTKTLKSVANLAIDYIADWCAIDLLRGDREVELVAVAHKDKKMVEWAQEIRRMYPIDFNAPQGEGHVLLTGESEIYPFISDEMLKQSVQTKEDYEIIEKIGLKSVMYVPIISRGTILGAITFVSSSQDNLFNEKTLKLAEDLARRSAQAIDNATLFKQANDELAERRKVEDALRVSEQRFRKLLDSNILGVFVSKIDGSIVEANKFFLEMIGYSQKDLESNAIRWDEITPQKWLGDDARIIEELKEYGMAGPWEKEYTRKNGTIIPVLLGATMLDPKEETVLTFALDISERKMLEQRKDDFISVASHELKTPITSMKVFTQLLSKRFEKKEDQQTVLLINKMDTQLNKLIVLVSDLLDVSRIHAGKLELRPTEFSITELVKESIESIEQTTAHKIVFKNGKEIRITGDRDRLGQVIINFLTNAIKYSPDHEDIIVHLKTDKKNVSVGIQDFGIGISKEDQDKIFDRFYQAKHMSGSTFPGLGMGLYISSEIISRHGGKIRVESEPNKGSHFIFTIPLHHSLSKAE